MTLQHSNSLPDSQYQSNKLYLKEALRLSELIITEQKDIFVTIERKAVLLVTLCIAITAYLLSSWAYKSWENKPCGEVIIMILSLITISVLINAARIGAKTLHTRPFGVPGADPEYPFQEGFSRNFNTMAECLLDHYNDIFIHNNKILNEKTDYFKSSLRWGELGIGLVCLWIILIFCYKLGIIPCYEPNIIPCYELGIMP